MDTLVIRLVSAMPPKRLKRASPNVRSSVARLGALLVAGIAAFLAPGCNVREAAVAAVGSAIRPTDSALVKKLETISNPGGEGVVVIVRPESGCVPKYGWLWLGGRNGSYALDDASQGTDAWDAAVEPGVFDYSKAYWLRRSELRVQNCQVCV